MINILALFQQFVFAHEISSDDLSEKLNSWFIDQFQNIRYRQIDV